MNRTSATAPQVAPPGVNSDAYYLDWLQELSELRKGGLISDEDFALSRAERLDALFNDPGKPWRKWLVCGLPLSLLIGGGAAWWVGDLTILYNGMGISLLCVLAAIGSQSRVRSEHLSQEARLDILCKLLERDLISSAEFAEYEHRFLAPE